MKRMATILAAAAIVASAGAQQDIVYTLNNMYFTPTSDSTVSVSKIKDREDLLKGVVEIPSHITVQGKT